MFIWCSIPWNFLSEMLNPKFKRKYSFRIRVFSQCVLDDTKISKFCMQLWLNFQVPFFKKVKLPSMKRLKKCIHNTYCLHRLDVLVFSVQVSEFNLHHMYSKHEKFGSLAFQKKNAISQMKLMIVVICTLFTTTMYINSICFFFNFKPLLVQQYHVFYVNLNVLV